MSDVIVNIAEGRRTGIGSEKRVKRNGRSREE